jgi:general secretion pathway protein G
MLAVAIVVILATIAVPTYRSHVDRARVTQAIAEIGGLSLQLNHWQSNMFRYPDSLAEAGIAGMTDPWGRPYRYLRIATANPGQVRRDKNLVPINTDFDLYSVGKDGVTVSPLTAAQSRDDVVRANDGTFIGLGEDY